MSEPAPFCCDKTSKESFKLGRGTVKFKFSQKVNEVGESLRSVRNTLKLEEWGELPRQKLVPHYRYYGISGNMSRLWAFSRKTLRLVYKWINRRSQNRSYNWDQFSQFPAYNPLPEPRTDHLTYTLSSHEDAPLKS